MTCETFLGIAFFKGSQHSAWDSLVRASTHGPYVHTELFLVGNGFTSSYGAFHGIGGFLPSRNKYHPDSWDTLIFPLSVSGYDHALLLASQLTLQGIPYNTRDLWQCCVKCILPFEKDVDCQSPSSWAKGVFCSQACLLFMRCLARRGLLPLHTGLRQRMEFTNSRGCSPNDLFKMLASEHIDATSQKK
jgi:hypothetical protein